LRPSGLIGKYCKLHLPFVGADRFLNHGDLPLEVYDTEIGKIGLGICYDMNFPEHGRTLALNGADIVVNITNWPRGIEFAPEHIIHTRAIENHVYYLTVNRVRVERGVNFIGSSKFVNPLGKTIVSGNSTREEILVNEINPESSRKKTVVDIPGELETNCMGDRRPEFYGTLIKPKTDNSRIR
jgi:predicted amidohydrolase